MQEARTLFRGRILFHSQVEACQVFADSVGFVWRPRLCEGAPERIPARAGKRLLMYVFMILAAVAGGVALSWELLWQLESSLALGVSAKGTAITLATTMGGMCIGSLVAGGLLKRRRRPEPLRIYGVLELIIGFSGLAMLPGFKLLMLLDRRLHLCSPAWGSLFDLAGIVLLLGPPTMAMGATVPVFGLIAHRFRTALSGLYAVNAAGAALGVLLMSFLIVPVLGVQLSVRLLAASNFLVCVASMRLGSAYPPESSGAPGVRVQHAASGAPQLLVPGLTAFCTGLVTFTLEVAWFRSLRAAFGHTTDSFAMVLATVLIAIAAGARLARQLAKRKVKPPCTLAVAGVAILLATPLIERFDLLGPLASSYWMTMLLWFGCALLVMGIPMLLLAAVFPALLDEQHTPARWGILNGLSTTGGITGALLAAWLMLPSVGLARTSWVAGGVLGVLAIVLSRSRMRVLTAVACGVALVAAMTTESGLGIKRFQGERGRGPYKVLAHREGPDSTVSVVEFEDGWRALMIDGFMAAAEGNQSHYMEWMGRLPMLLHPAPERALVIAFGTGQTANGVRKEGPSALDVVELNQAVIDMAGYFALNEGVLADPRVQTVVMDGRAWLRRTRRRYDIVTLEPMPPHFAGINALYSLEFYQLMAKRLKPGAVVAQWIPYHLLPPEYALSVAATFRTVFPNCIVWVDPVGGTGIILGRHEGNTSPLGSHWPGLARRHDRNLDGQTIRCAVRLNSEQVARYVGGVPTVTDDNQMLAYGQIRRKQDASNARINYRLMALIRRQTGSVAEDGAGDRQDDSRWPGHSR